MIDIKDVKTEYCIGWNDCGMPTEDLQSVWGKMGEVERGRCYTAVKEQLRFDARDVLYSLISNVDGFYSDAAEILEEVDDNKIDSLQAVLDRITDSERYDMYFEVEPINPESEMPYTDSDTTDLEYNLKKVLEILASEAE